MKAQCRLKQQPSTARQDFAEVFNLICKHGKKTGETRTNIYYSLNGVTAGDNGVARSLVKGKKVITEGATGPTFGQMSFVGITEKGLNKMAQDMRSKFTV